MRRVAVVVASFRSPALLEACLDSIERAREGHDAPVIVARRDSGADVRHLFRSRPWATLVPVQPPADVPRLRGVGMGHAEAEWIAVTEDHCVVDGDWLTALVDATDADAVAVGGSMGNARRGPVTWGAYFSEYGFFSASQGELRKRPLLTGANVAYRADVVEDVARWAEAGCWENVIHDRLWARGEVLRFAPRAMVFQNATYRIGAFCKDRFQHGLTFARTRSGEESGFRRLLLLAGTPLLPPLLTWRVARAAWSDNPGAFAISLPFTVVFLSAWASGEALGYLSGRANDR